MKESQDRRYYCYEEEDGRSIILEKMQDERLLFRIVDRNLGVRWIEVLGRIYEKKGIMVISRFEIEIILPR